MNKFRVNLHNILLNNESESSGGFENEKKWREKAAEPYKQELGHLSEFISADKSEIRKTIVENYISRLNEIDFGRKNKFYTIYYNLYTYDGWDKARIENKNSGKRVIIRKMDYVLGSFIYMEECGVKTLDDVTFKKVFGGLEKDRKVITEFYNAYLEQKDLKKKQIQESDKHRSKSPSETRRNNESLASSAEKQEEAITDKELRKQLNQLAKNKKIDFPWTDNEWKCSRKEKGLACASAKVFQQLLEKGTLNQMLEECRFRTNPLTKEDAEAWGYKCKINSKAKDIQKFHQAYQEYQNPQSEYQHLKNLMGFFCENNFEDLESVKKSLTERSRKISKQELNAKKEELYNGVKKPKDWKQRASFEIIKDRLNKGSET